MFSPKYYLEKILICDYCGLEFNTKDKVRRHILRLHMPKTEELTCSKCNIIFKTNELLLKHNEKVHKVKRPKKNIRKQRVTHLCYACQINFRNLSDLKYHIREFHFNLLAKVPYLNFKKVNQVWFENVVNSKNVVEIKKVAENAILIRKLDDNTAMKVGEQPTEVIDLRDMYPTKRAKTVQCDICLKLYEKMYINKHRADVHAAYS